MEPNGSNASTAAPQDCRNGISRLLHKRLVDSNQGGHAPRWHHFSAEGQLALSGVDDLRAAESALTHGAGEGRSQVHEAAQQVWSAFFYRDEWPLELQTKAAALEPRLFRYGTIQMTVAQMDEAELDELRNELLAFIAAAESFT